jgi:hypothetical protein
VRRLAAILGALVLAVAAAAGAVAFFNARDDAEVARGGGAGGPGVPVERLGPAAERARQTTPGNVQLLYADRTDAPALRRLAEAVAGPPSPELEAAGQAVLVVREPAVGHGVLALAGGRGLRTDDPADPRLRAFVEAWLGRAG